MKSCCQAVFLTRATNKFLSTWRTKTYLHMLLLPSAGFLVLYMEIVRFSLIFS